MARMLRTGASSEYGCCDACEGPRHKTRKNRKRERHLARAREKKIWKVDNGY